MRMRIQSSAVDRALKRYDGLLKRGTSPAKAVAKAAYAEGINTSTLYRAIHRRTSRKHPILLDTQARVDRANKLRAQYGCPKWKLGDHCWYPLK